MKHEPLLIPFSGQHVLAIQSASKTADAFLFFHGFPANKGVKNQDLATAVHEATGKDVFLIHYRGLGSAPGFFQFSHSIQESVALAKQLSQSYERVHLVGHSWGGLVAMNVCLELGAKAGRLVLLSPLSIIPDDHIISEVVAGVIAELPNLFGTQTMREILEDLHSVREKRDPRKCAGLINFGDFVPLILQALDDDSVPASLTRTFLGAFSVRPKYLELPQDHSFSRNRGEFVRRFVELIRT